MVAPLLLYHHAKKDKSWQPPAPSAKAKDWKKKDWDLQDYDANETVGDKMARYRSLTKGRAKPELTNTRRKNMTLKQSIEAHKKYMAQLQRDDPAAWRRQKKARDGAAIKIQSWMRMLLAQKLAKKERERLETQKRVAARKLQQSQETQAAIKIQALMRSALTRMRVATMVDQLIRDIIREEAETEAAIRIQTIWRGALARMRVRQRVEDMIAQLLEMQREFDEQRRQDELDAAERAEREAIAAEEARIRAEKDLAEKERLAARRSKLANANLFVGPLQDGAGLLPAWWMEYTPHKQLHLDDYEDLEVKWLKQRKQKYYKLNIQKSQLRAGYEMRAGIFD